MMKIFLLLCILCLSCHSPKCNGIIELKESHQEDTYAITLSSNSKLLKKDTVNISKEIVWVQDRTNSQLKQFFIDHSEILIRLKKIPVVIFFKRDDPNKIERIQLTEAGQEDSEKFTTWPRK